MGQRLALRMVGGWGGRQMLALRMFEGGGGGGRG